MTTFKHLHCNQRLLESFLGSRCLSSFETAKSIVQLIETYLICCELLTTGSVYTDPCAGLSYIVLVLLVNK